MTICLLTCTYNRHTLLERVARCLLEQDYEGDIYWIIYNNSRDELHFADGDEDFERPENRMIRIVNNHIDKETKQAYTSTGAIFRDAIQELEKIPVKFDIISFMDDDDLYSYNHVSEGIKGMEKAYEEEKLAYKPEYSIFRWGMGKTEKAKNSMEPSIFVDYNYIKEEGFNLTSVDYHQKWLNKLIRDDQILVDRNGKSTFIYDWNGDTGAFKMSGGENTVANFLNHKRNSVDAGDGILFPQTIEQIPYKITK